MQSFCEQFTARARSRCWCLRALAAGATWDVYPGDSIQGAIDGAGAGDMKMFM